MSSVLGMDNDEALTAIRKAEFAVASAYEAVLEAEKAGANVSDLLEKLNVGAENLTKACMLYRIGDLEGAAHFADLCRSSVVDVTNEAETLRDLAVVERKKQVLVISLASTFGVGVTVFGGFLGWRRFKEWYLRRVLKMKPEVVSNES